MAMFVEQGRVAQGVVQCYSYPTHVGVNSILIFGIGSNATCSHFQATAEFRSAEMGRRLLKIFTIVGRRTSRFHSLFKLGSVENSVTLRIASYSHSCGSTEMARQKLGIPKSDTKQIIMV